MIPEAKRHDFPARQRIKKCSLLIILSSLLFPPGKGEGMVADTAFKPGRNSPCLLITDQSQNRIALAEVRSSRLIWQWRAGETDIRPQDTGRFKAPSDAKAVYEDKYILASASLGRVALIRIADKKTVFYMYVGGNTHSAERWPDGNIVTASSTGNYLTVIHTDSVRFADSV